jgi:hypothetical protein
LFKIATKRQSILALTVAFALCLAASLRPLRHVRNGYLETAKQSDFGVYYVASSLVRHHLNSHLYDDAGTGTDPQQRFASDDSVFAGMARSEGIARTKLYVYPPFLADAMLPFTWLSFRAGAWAWRFLNLFAVVLSAGLVSRLLGFPTLSRPALLVLAGLFCFSPLWQGLHYGQITIVLLALWSAGILFYAQGWTRASALVISVAALIKITPLLVAVPILIWRDWRWTRWFAGGLALGCGVMCVLNSPATLMFYGQHVIPPMSAGIIHRQNLSVLSVVGLLWSHGRDYADFVVPHRVVLLGKLISAGLMATAALLTIRRGSGVQPPERTLVLAAFALLSLCVSPVSWLDALVLGYILLALLWERMLRGGRTLAELLLLVTTTIALGTTLALEDRTSPWFQLVPLLFTVVLVLYVLAGRWHAEESKPQPVNS